MDVPCFSSHRLLVADCATIPELFPVFPRSNRERSGVGNFVGVTERERADFASMSAFPLFHAFGVLMLWLGKGMWPVKYLCSFSNVFLQRAVGNLTSNLMHGYNRKIGSINQVKVPTCIMHLCASINQLLTNQVSTMCNRLH